MKHKDALDREEMIEFVVSCWDDEAGRFCLKLCVGGALTFTTPLRLLLTGAFGAHPSHDAHLHATLSAIQILLIQDAMDRVDVDRVTKCALVLHTYDVLDDLTSSITSYPFAATTFRRFRGRQIWGDRHAFLLLCCQRAITSWSDTRARH